MTVRRGIGRKASGKTTSHKLMTKESRPAEAPSTRKATAEAASAGAKPDGRACSGKACRPSRHVVPGSTVTATGSPPHGRRSIRCRAVEAALKTTTCGCGKRGRLYARTRPEAGICT